MLWGGCSPAAGKGKLVRVETEKVKDENVIFPHSKQMNDANFKTQMQQKIASNTKKIAIIENRSKNQK